MLSYNQISKSSVLYTKKFFIGYDKFQSGGSLWLGKWYITKYTPPGVPIKPFKGSIDNIKIWNSYLDAVKIKRAFSMPLQSGTHGKAIVWLFDEGEGKVIRSLGNVRNSFFLPDVSSRRPNWEFSYSFDKPPYKDSLQNMNKSLQILAETECRQVIYDSKMIRRYGKYFSKAQLLFYYQACVNTINATDDLSDAYALVMSLAEDIQTRFNLTSSPAQHLCHELPGRPLWIGPDCDKRCVFGKAHVINASFCVCDFGYWGGDCASECPGGVISPCNGHGKCNAVSGHCNCELNWRGKLDCSVCSPGWSGIDCSIAVSTGHSPTCSGFTGGHFTTFDGAHFNNFYIGELWLIENPSFKSQVRQIPCENGMSRCINAVGFAYQDLWEVIIYAPRTSYGHPTVYVNNRRASFESTKFQLKGGAYLEFSSSSTFRLVGKTAGLKIKIRVFDRRLSFNQQASPTICKSQSSLCGNCDGNSGNDMNSVSRAQNNWKVEEHESFFHHKFDDYEDQNNPTGAEFGLKFKGVGLSTSILPHVFTSNFVTVHLWFKTAMLQGGALFTYSKSISFTLIVNKTLNVLCKNDAWDSGLQPNIKEWNQVTMVYYRVTGVLTLYHTTSNGIVNSNTKTTTSGLFTIGGIIALGQWIPGYEDAAIDFPRGFVGYLDEIQIWNKEFTLAEVKQSFGENVQNTAAHLAILWKLNEGQGRIINDLVSNVNLYIPLVQKAPTWIYSSANIQILSITNIIKFSDVSLETKAKTWCTSNLQTSPVGRLCNGMGVGSMEFYFRSCLRIISSFGFLANASESILTFADSCQASINLNVWPARQMCNYDIFKHSRFSWIGINCDIPCVFGHSSSLYQNQCKCETSFWGSNCDKICAGGSLNTCYGHGTCSAKTGDCSCEYNWRGKFDCSVCSPGFYGIDCSVAFIPSGPFGVGSVSGSGHYVTMDGLKLALNSAGEVYAFISSHLKVKVQIRLVRQGIYTYIRCTAVQLPGNINIAIHTSYGGAGSVLVTINGLLINPKKDVSLGSSGYFFSRVSYNKYVISGPENFQLQVYQRGSDMGVALTMDRTAFSDSCGMLAQWQNNTNRCTVNNKDGLQNISLVTQEIIDSTFQSWLVPLNESGFRDVLKYAREPHVNTKAGSCLFMNDTSLITPPLVKVFTGTFVSVQFYIKSKDPHQHGGIVISFALNLTFAVNINSTIKIVYGPSTYDTGLILETLKWNQLSLVYWKTTGLLQIYLIYSNGSLSLRTIPIGLGVFPSGCTLGVGIFQVTTVKSSIPGFVGSIDELVIWNRRLDAITIQTLWKVSLDASIPGITALWKFNEGSGYYARDSIGIHDISLPRPPWKTPQYEASDLVITSEAAPSVSLFSNKDLEKKANRLCYEIMLSGPFNKQCADAVGNSDLYYQNCLQDIAAAGSLNAAIESTISMATLCEVALNLTNLPGQQLCNMIPDGRYNEWVGKNCSTRCVNGVFFNGKCVCNSGYWSNDCSQQCPGGAANPCHGHGHCNVESGKCVCSWNWEGDNACRSCSEGWIGESCSIAISTATNNKTTSRNATVACTILEDGYVSGFDGSHYTFSTVGEFVMIASPEIEVQIRQVPCYAGTLCINAVALSCQGVQLSVHAPYSKEGKASWHMFGKSIEDKIEDGLSVKGISIRKLVAKMYQIEVDQYLTMTVLFSDRYLSIETEAGIKHCGAFGGLCGSCRSSDLGINGTTTNNTATIKSTVLEEFKKKNTSTSMTINDFIENKLKVTYANESDYLIVINKEKHKETRKVYGGLYCLDFNFSAVMSNKVIDLFGNDALTIQLLIKSCKSHICGGVILSYASFDTFYISNYKTVHVGIGSDIYDTHLETDTHMWNMISVVVHQNTMKMFVYMTDSVGRVLYKSFIIKSYPFVNGGTLAIGLWQPASGAKITPIKHIYKGVVDEVRVWNKAFDYVVIKQSWSANILADVSSLKGLWKFNEGEGSSVKDSLLKNHLTFSFYPLRTPVWIFSDAQIDLVVGTNPNENNVTLLALAEEQCYRLIFSGSIFKHCKEMGNVTLQFYFRACTSKILSTGKMSQSMEVIITFASICQSKLDLPLWPAQRLCNAFPGMEFPNWIGRNCTTPCVFGKAFDDDPEVCICNQGYFGTNCSGVCYGGSVNTCNQHGTCDNQTGECNCELNWSGDTNCTKCSPGWKGRDCSFAITEGIAIGNRLAVSTIALRGRVTTFSGLSYVLNLIGEYFLIYSSSSTVQAQIRLVECYERFTCVRDIAVRIGGHSIIVHAPQTSSSKVIVWIDNQQTNIDLNPPSLTRHGFTLTRLSLGLYSFKCPKLTISIRVHGKYLMIITKPSREICHDSIGILGDCSNDYLASLESYLPGLNCNSTPFNITLKQDANFSVANLTTIKAESLISKLKVKKCHGMFLYSYDGVIEYPDANSGYTLYFNKTAIISATPIVHAFRSNEITIDLMIKIREHGVILSYSKIKTLFVTSAGGKFTIMFGNTTLYTNIKAEMNIWCQIVLVYTRSTSVLQFYYFSSDGLAQRIDFELKLIAAIFEPGGYLAVGGWLPSLDGSGPYKATLFSGLIDQLRIWNHYFHPAVIQQIWKREVLVETNTLKHAWRFNQGQGTVAIDTIGKIDLKLPNNPWRYPEWKNSDIVLKTSFYKERPLYHFYNKSIQKGAEEFCYKLFVVGSVQKTCKNLGEGFIMFYYRSCLRTIAIQNNLNAALEVVIDFSDYCQNVLGLKVWPAKPLCNDFTGRDFPTWFGAKCDHVCINGIPNSQRVCICENGFWGEDCSKVCPGGAANPCNSHGDCNFMTGKCTCKANWQGTKTCSTCSRGWVGNDCSVATSSSSLISTVSNSGQYGTFDGVNFILHRAGEFTLIKKLGIDVIMQIRQVPCYLRSVCVNAVAAKFSNNLITLHGPYKTNQNEAIIWVNGHVVQLDKLVTSIGEHLNITKVSRNHYKINWKDIVTLYVRTYGRYLSVKLHANTILCTNSTGNSDFNANFSQKKVCK